MHWGRRIGLGVAVVALAGGTLVGGSAVQLSAAFAGNRDAAKQAKAAAKQAKLAERALKQDAWEEAIGRAEQAVLLSDRDPRYRELLGRAYLSVGRFASARQALEDAVTLGDAESKTALNLALARIATGEWAGAREILEAHAATIQPADRGLAIALAGDPMGAVLVLAQAAKDPAATAKTRQNLALALALAGKWPEARTIAMLDLQPGEADQRLVQWAQFAHPARASDQVASLLGVTAAEDGGLPEQLALARSTDRLAIAQLLIAPPAAKEVAEPAPPVVPVPVRIKTVPLPTAFLDQQGGPEAVRVMFASRREIVQALPVDYAPPALLARVAPPRAAAPARKAANESFHVQLGAFDNAAIARSAWSRMAQRILVLRDRQPQGMNAMTPAGKFYRLSVGGLSRADAATLCSTVRSEGSNCFVRRNSGDLLAAWATAPRYAANQPASLTPPFMVRKTRP